MFKKTNNSILADLLAISEKELKKELKRSDKMKLCDAKDLYTQQ